MSDDRVELKNCPFCGGLAEMSEPPAPWFVRCPNCLTDGPSAEGGDTKRAAIAAWNTRALDPSIESLQAEVDRKDAALQKIKRTAIKAGLPIVLLQQVADIARQALAAKGETQ